MKDFKYLANLYLSDEAREHASRVMPLREVDIAIYWKAAKGQKQQWFMFTTLEHVRVDGDTLYHRGADHFLGDIASIEVGMTTFHNEETV